MNINQEDLYKRGNSGIRGVRENCTNSYMVHIHIPYFFKMKFL